VAARGIGRGRLILVVGPSGAGKDSLIAQARSLCQSSDVVFPRRVVTRPSAAAEDHDSMDDEAFDRAAARGDFSIWWRAHGLKYGIPASIEPDIRAGRSVVCNVSRAVVGEVRERFAQVLVVLVTAPPQVLAARVAQRGRATDGSIASRINRTVGTGEFRPDIVIDNSGSIEEGGRRLLAAIVGAPDQA
jgi:ribose 1,5-bisphosphokinase